MITTAQFELFAAQHGITKESGFLYELTKATWEACEKTCMHSYNKVPVLLKSQKPNVIFAETYREKAFNSFNQSELQFLVDKLKQGLSNYDNIQHLINQAINTTWHHCDPDNAFNDGDFQHLNNLKDQKRKLKSEYNKLASIQRKLKKMR